MRRPVDLSRAALETIVDAVQQHLYLDHDKARGFVWNPDKDWSGADVLEQLAGLLAQFDLSPEFSKPFVPS